MRIGEPHGVGTIESINPWFIQKKESLKMVLRRTCSGVVCLLGELHGGFCILLSSKDLHYLELLFGRPSRISQSRAKTALQCDKAHGCGNGDVLLEAFSTASRYRSTHFMGFVCLGVQSHSVELTDGDSADAYAPGLLQVDGTHPCCIHAEGFAEKILSNT